MVESGQILTRSLPKCLFPQCWQMGNVEASHKPSNGRFLEEIIVQDPNEYNIILPFLFAWQSFQVSVGALAIEQHI